MRQALISFNRGKISPLAIARVDQKRVSLSAETYTNWIPRELGPMSLRPGWEYITSSLSNNTARHLPFVFSTTDKAIIELTDSFMRVIIDDVPLTRPSVSSAVANGGFDTDLTSWTDNDEVGATSAWVAGGYMGLTGDGTANAIRDQQVTVAAADQNKEHALRVIINRGPVILRVGSTSGDDDYVSETSLETGDHSLSFTPTGNFHIQFKSNLKRIVYVDSCNVEASGVVSIPTPWPVASLSKIRFDQSGDVLFTCDGTYQQRRIERRATRSWSVARYATEDGPLRIENTGPITITPSAISGNITLTASDDLFKSTNVGSLYQITSEGQEVTKDISAENDFTTAIKVTGVGSDRTFTIVLTGTWVGTVTLQRSLESSTGPWSDVSGKTWTANTTETFADGLDNQKAWYRIGIKTGDYTSGTVSAKLTIEIGSITGTTRITAYTNSTTVSAEVLTDLGGTDATDIWAESEWSDRRGWPTSVRFYEGRLWWAGQDSIIGSVSDAFDSFDSETEGDSAPINRSIGSGPVDTINWILGVQRLMLGGEGAEFSAKSSSLDEPLTTTSFGIKTASTQGSAGVEPVIIDQNGAYVQRGGVKIYELAFDANSYEYGSTDMTALVPEMGDPGIVRMVVQRQPDTRIHAIKSDGTVMLGVLNKAEEVLAWVDITTDGEVEDAVILPNTSEDAVYYSVKRTINGSEVRYLEKWALETECRGGTLNKQADSFYVYQGIPTFTITGLGHLEGEEVVVWGDGADIGTKSDYTQTYTVSSGEITLTTAVAKAVVGLPYTAQWKSSKLTHQAESVVDLLMNEKHVDHIGLILAWVHPLGLRYGPDFDNLDDMPGVEQGEIIDPDTIRATYAEQEIEFPGTWATDSRICLQAQAPRPVTVLAAIPNLKEGR
jgi:hypothetical protein